MIYQTQYLLEIGTQSNYNKIVQNSDTGMGTKRYEDFYT